MARAKPKKPRAPAGMPVAPLTKEGEREALAHWWDERLKEMEERHTERIQNLQQGHEHPLPFFANQVRNAGALGLSRPQAAKFIGISTHSLETYYADDYELGKAEVVTTIAANMIRIGSSITDPNNAKVGMQILDRRGGEEWRPPAQKIDMTSESEKPKNVIDTTGWSAEDRQALRDMLERNVEGTPDEEDEGPVGGGLVPVNGGGT